MLLSMTGFGKASVQLPDKKITAEIKSLNSKQFDMQTRIPSFFRELEQDLRTRLASKLERGKVDLILTVEMLDGAAPVTLNIPVLKAYKQQIEQLGAELGIDPPADWYATLLRLPEAMRSDSQPELTEEDTAAAINAVESASDHLMDFRRKEGEKLEVFFTARIQAISDMLELVPKWEHERVTKIRSRLEDSLGKIAQVEYDRGRLEQELIYYIEKLDVNEEKQRLAQHLSYFIETLRHPAPGQGKKLGFIAQEMGREINTLGSKSNHADMQRLVVKMKDELEQIKEQVLNVM